MEKGYQSKGKQRAVLWAGRDPHMYRPKVLIISFLWVFESIVIDGSKLEISFDEVLLLLYEYQYLWASSNLMPIVEKNSDLRL